MGPNHETITIGHQELSAMASKFSSIYQRLVDLFAVPLPNNKIEINYLFQDLYHHSTKLIKITAPAEVPIHSLQHLWPIAEEWENEIFDLFGVKFDKKENKRIFTQNFLSGHLFNNNTRPLPNTNEVAAADIPDNLLHISPRYPKVQDTFKIQVRSYGEMVLAAEAQIGKDHWGFEKYCQGISLNSVNPLIERLDLDHAFSNSLLWSMSCEKLLGIEIDKRTKIIRMIFLELGRIYGHIGYLINILFEHNYNDLFYQMLKIKKQMQNYYLAINSNEGGMKLCQIGKVNLNDDLPWTTMLDNLIPWLEKQLRRIKQSLHRQNTWYSKNQTCRFSKEDVLAWSLSGPLARATGMNLDLRTQLPFYYYPEINFKVPLGMAGNAYDIYLVRVEEMFISLNVIRQLLDNLPYGRKNFAAPNFSLMDFRSFTGETYHRLEGADGQYGLYLKIGQNLTIQRLRLSTPSFSSIFAFTQKIGGENLEATNPLLSGLNISPGELDR